MKYLCAPSQAAGELVKALGLPRETTEVTLQIKSGGLATVAAVMHADEGVGEKVGQVLKLYRLVEVDPDAPPPTNPLRDELQQQCSEWGTYWRASDAHGVQLTPEQATELLQRALGVEVEIFPPEA